MQSRAGATHIVSGGNDYDIAWPNNTIPYDWDESIDDTRRAMIISAMNDVMKAVPNCWKFVPRRKEKHWVRFQNLDDRCYSNIGNGNIYGTHPQIINFGGDFCIYGAMVHELLHTLGFMHEMTRNDRDEFIDVFFERIPDGVKHNFKLDREMNYKTDYYGVPYNFKSIQHYGFNLAGMIKNPVMANKRNQKAIGWDMDDNDVGQTHMLSNGDLKMMAAKGKCKGGPTDSETTYPITGATPRDPRPDIEGYSNPVPTTPPPKQCKRKVRSV